MTKKKKIVVNKKFLNDLADTIYNPKTKKFLRLCDGAMTNGPDPTDESRKMHCGLGELYFAMTGKHAGGQSGVTEYQVVELAFNLSTLNGAEERAEEETRKAIKSLNLHKDVESQLLDQVDGVDHGFMDKENEFKDMLNDIPDENDDGKGHSSEGYVDEEDGNVYDVCTPANFRARSKRVAAQLRRAAALLPE